MLRISILRKLTSLGLLISLCSGILLTDRGSAETRSEGEGPLPPRQQQAKSQPSLLDKYTTNLTDLARVSGPTKEYATQIRSVMRILQRGKRPLLIGGAGVTRKAVEVFAQRLVSGEAPATLRNKSLLQLNLGSLLADSKHDSDFRDRLSSLLSETQQAQSAAILFVEDIDALTQADFVGREAVSGNLENLLANRDVQIVASSTLSAFKESIKQNLTFMRHFAPVYVGDPERDESDLSEIEDNDSETRARAQKVSPDLRALVRNGGSSEARVSVILQLDKLKTDDISGLLARPEVQITQRLPQFGALVVQLPARMIEELALGNRVRHISLNRKIEGLGHISSTTGADAVRLQATMSSGGETTDTIFDGSGIGVAVIDSGIYDEHTSFKDRDGASRVILSLDFAGEGLTNDAYGHGTHVAATATGNGRVAQGHYRGIASNANIFSLRVLNSSGIGTASNLLSALDWVLNNHLTYNIRVVNLSLGTLAIDSYQNDPLCQAVRQLVNEGVVVVAAAGNNGRAGSGQEIYGLIHSPGNEPGRSR